jgi:glycosyltransferase involved in cell wall biosynthesis
MRISLCVICGNEKEHIISMLNSFAGIFDELSLVRAVGAKKTDETCDLAHRWCLNNGKEYLFAEYLNGVGSEKWEHVDDFAAARNKAFENGTGDWLIWADCDDIFSGDAKEFRERLEALAESVAMVRCYYDVKQSGKKLYRERAIRRSLFHANRRWHHSVHENLLLLEGDKHEDWDRFLWIHSPVEIKRDNRRRNLRILGHSVRETASQFFYIHQEHYCSQNRDAALEYGRIALTFPNLQPAFRYETLLNMARLSYSRRDANLFLMEAHGIFPWCREALAALILLCFERKEYAKAKIWADKMSELREPLAEERPWTHEVRWYGWSGFDLAARAYRAYGNDAMANVLQAQFHGGMKPRISLLHATRGRTSKAVAARDAWLSQAHDPSQVEHIFAVDSDDKTSVEMAKQFVSVVSSKKSCVAAWNAAARMARGDLLVQLSDDWQPCQGWDKQLLEACVDADLQKKSLVIAIDDGARKDQLLCMAILSRARFEEQGGEVFFDGYDSVFSDNEFSYRAFSSGVVIDARDKIRFEHLHPIFGKAPMDATYEHNNQKSRYEAGLALFQQRNPNAPQWNHPTSQS